MVRKKRLKVDIVRLKIIFAMFKSIMKIYMISRVLKMKYTTISAIVRHIGLQKISNRRGLKHTLCVRLLPGLSKQLSYNLLKPLSAITAEYNLYKSLHLSERTIRHYIQRLKICSNVSIKKPFLKHKHVPARLKCARGNNTRTPIQCSTESITDMFSFTIRAVKNCVRVWRKQSQSYYLRYPTPLLTSGYEIVSVWGTFLFRRQTSLARIIGGFNQ